MEVERQNEFKLKENPGLHKITIKLKKSVPKLGKEYFYQEKMPTNQIGCYYTAQSNEKYCKIEHFMLLCVISITQAKYKKHFQ